MACEAKAAADSLLELLGREKAKAAVKILGQMDTFKVDGLEYPAPMFGADHFMEVMDRIASHLDAN